MTHSSIDRRVDVPTVTSSGSHGGYRWFLLATVFIAWITTFLVRMAWSSAGGAVTEELGFSTSSIGTFVTSFFVGYVISNVCMGFITDRIGCRLAISLSLMPLAGATFLFGTFDNLYVGLLFQCLMGLSAGVDNAACNKLVATWFRNSRLGLAMGLFATGPSLAIGLASSVYPYLIERFDWRTLYYGLGLWTAAVAIIIYVVVRNGPVGQTTTSQVSIEHLKRLFRDRNLIMLAIAGFGAIWATWGFAFWATTLMTKARGFSVAEASTVMLLFSIGAVVTKPLIGWFSDRLGGQQKALIILCVAALAVLLMLFGQLTGLTALYLIAPALGCAAFNYTPLMNAMITKIVGISSTASAIGVMNGFWQMGSVIAPSAVAYAYALTQSFTVAFSVLAAGPALATVAMVFVQGNAGKPNEYKEQRSARP